MGNLTAFAESTYPTNSPSPPAGDDFNLDTAATLAWAAQLAYELSDAAKTKRILARWGWTGLTILNGTVSSTLPLVSTWGYVATAQQAVIVAFAGTEPDSLRNWATDLDLLRSPAGIADGFLAAYEAVADDLKQALQTSVQPDRPVYFAGHSLGASIAAVAADRLATDDGASPRGGAWLGRISGIYTIGMPRTGDADFADSYDRLLGDRTYRLVHGDDIVPRVPPDALPFGFRHVGRALTCAHAGTFSGTPQPGDPGNGLGLLREVWGALGFAHHDPAVVLPPFPAAFPGAAALIEAQPRIIRDHLTDRYLRALGETW